MVFPEVTEAQKTAVLDAVDHAKRVKQHGASFMRRVVSIFQEHEFERDWGVKAVLGADGIEASFETIFGSGRGGLRLFFDELGVYGQYVIERRFENATGHQEWKDVWALRVTREGQIFPGGGAGTAIPSRSHLDREQDMPAYEVARSIFYRLGVEIL